MTTPNLLKMTADGGEVGALVDAPVLPVPGVDDAPRVSEQHDHLVARVFLVLTRITESLNHPWIGNIFP